MNLRWILLALAFLTVATLPARASALSQDTDDAAQATTVPTEEIEEPSDAPATGEAGGRLSSGDVSRAGAAGIAPMPRRPAPPAVWETLRPTLSGANLMWVAVVVILALMIQTRPILSWRNADALVLALSCVALVLRFNTSRIAGDPTPFTIQGWAYTALTAFAVYWLVRGYRLMATRSNPFTATNLSPGALAVLAIAALGVSLHTIVSTPLSAGSIDGIVGGVCMAETGKLPYGDAAGHDTRSPLLYAAHAGAVKAWPPTADLEGISWATRERWLGDFPKRIDPAPAQLVNALLFVLMFGGLAWLGHRLHSVAMGLTLATIFAVYPGTAECLTRPEIMLPATLVTWSLAFLTIPAVGGLLSTFLIVVAGLAWPWAWLLLPAMLVYFFRLGFQGFGAALGTLAGIAGCGALAFYLTAPSLPRVEGAMETAGYSPKFTAVQSGNREIVLNASKLSPETSPDRDRFKGPLWGSLLSRDDVRLDSRDTPVTLPPGVDAGSVRYRDIAPIGYAAETTLTRSYRDAMEREHPATQILAGVRTIAEATWLPPVPRDLPIPSVWTVWAGGSAINEHSLITARRATKIAVVGLALLTLWPLIRRKERPMRHQAIGALLGISAAILLASEVGAAGNLVWLLPAALAGVACASAGGGTPVTTVPAANPLNRPGVGTFSSSGQVPRITVEK